MLEVPSKSLQKRGVVAGWYIHSLLKAIWKWKGLFDLFIFGQLTRTSLGRMMKETKVRMYSQLQSHNYSRLTVNHSLNFVDQVTGAHTQCVERMWGACKQMLREEKTMHSTLFETYLPEFMWRRKFDSFRDNSFNNILKHIAEQYPQ